MPASVARRTLYPFRFSPLLKDYTWGGRKLATHLGRALPGGVTAESWEVSAHPRGSTTVANGPLAGRTLAELQRDLGIDLVGRRCRQALAHDRFPLLIKLLDAAEWLSVQVHPDDDWALAREGDHGKTEMWIVLQADDGAELIHGFEPDVDRARFAAAVRRGAAESCLHRSSVRAGDVFFIPPGTVHALGPGILLAEIQQSSDVTYRVFDWNRDQADRPLHLEQSLDVLDFDLVRPQPVIPRSATGDGWRDESLVSCPYFETHRLRIAAGGSWGGECSGETFEIWGAIEGGARLRWDGGEEPLGAVEWVLLPAGLGPFELTAAAECTLLRVLTPAPTAGQTGPRTTFPPAAD